MKKVSFVQRAMALFLCVGILFAGYPGKVFAEEYDTGLTVTSDLPSDSIVVNVESSTIPDVTVEPTAEAMAEQTIEPTAEATVEPTIEPTIEATAEQTVEPTIEVTVEPTAEPTVPPELDDEELEVYNAMLEVGAYSVMLNDLGETVYAVVRDGSLLGKYAPGETVTLTVPTKEGYDFTGWKVVCSEAVTITDNQFVMPSASVGVVSQWKAQTCQVAIYYVTTSGSRIYDANFSTVLKGSSFSLSDSFSLPQIDGYTVREIKHNGTSYTNTSDYKDIISVDNVMDDEVFYVVYEPAEVTYTVKSYLQNLDGESYSETESVSKNGKFGDTVVASSFIKSFAGFTWNGTEDRIVLSSNNESNVVRLYYTRNSYKLSYQKDGDTDTITVKYGETVNTSTLGTPSRVGYTFASWTYIDGTSVPASFEMPAHDVTLIAAWTPASVSYNIYYWQETLASANNLNEVEGYDFVESSIATAVTGTTVNGSNTKSFTGFEFDHADENVLVKADGSTIVNVYYKRSWYKYEFYIKDWGNNYTLSDTVSYKYGANLTASPYEWPNTAGYYWTIKDGDKYNPYGCPKLAIEGEDIKLYRAEAITTMSLYGWYEDGTYVVLNTWNGGGASWGNWSSSQRYTPEGYTAYFYGTDTAIPENNGDKVAVSTQNNIEGYHISLKKNSYTLTLNNGANDIGSHTYKYEESISNALSDMGISEVTPPSAYTGYTFDGWTWMHQSYSLEGKTMPASNMVLVASWKAPVYTVNFYDDETKFNLIHTEEVERGNTVIATPANPEKENRTFAGWFYIEDGTEKLYVEGKIINSSIDVYAKWLISDEIAASVTVWHKYYEADGSLIKEESENLSGIVGKMLTVSARSENGYYPDVLSQNILVSETGNVVTFNYVKMDNVQYTVHYVDADGNTLIPDKVANTSNLIIVEEYVYIAGATPRTLAQELRLTSNPAANVITFVYDVEGETSYTIKYWQEQLTGGYVEIVADRLEISGVRYYTQVFVTESQKKSYTGYELDESISNLSDWLMPDETIVLNLYYNLQEFTVTYKYSSTVDGVTMPELPSSQTYKFSETVSVASNELSIEGAPQYEFKGWYIEGETESEVTSFEMPNNDVVLYGYFALKEYYITVDWTKEDGEYHGGTYSWDCDKLEYVHDATAAGWNTVPYVKCVVKNLGVHAVKLDFTATTDKWGEFFEAGSNPFENIGTVTLEGGAEYVFEFRNDIELKWDYDKLNSEAKDVALGVASTDGKTNTFELSISSAE